jgi:hypothetical protein
MPYPDALGQQPLDKQQAYAALAQFAADYGRDALLLLIHACLPETLRPELLHLIRVNFQPGTDHSLEADILFSPLATALGGGYYRIDPQVRWHGLALLRARYRDDPRPRSRRVAELLWRYVEEAEQYATRNADPQLAEYLAIQRWVALAFLEPASAAHAFADALRQATDGPAAAAVRLGGLAAAIELPLAGEQELLAYARGLDALARGQEDEARQLLECLGEEVKVGDIVLKPPAVRTGRGQPPCHRRRHRRTAPAGRPALRAGRARHRTRAGSPGRKRCGSGQPRSHQRRPALSAPAGCRPGHLRPQPSRCHHQLPPWGGLCPAAERHPRDLPWRPQEQIFDSLTLSMAYRYEPTGDTAESRARFRAWIKAHAVQAGGPPLSPSPLYVDGKLRPPALAGPYANPHATAAGQRRPLSGTPTFRHPQRVWLGGDCRLRTHLPLHHGKPCETGLGLPAPSTPSNSAITHQDLRLLQEPIWSSPT